VHEFTEVLKYASHVQPPQPQREHAPHRGGLDTGLCFPSVAHVALTVTDLSRSIPWYQRLIGAPPVLDEDTGPFRHVVFALGDTLLGLHEHADGATGTAFEERRVGLDHVAFGCTDHAQLAGWQTRLDGLGIRHGGIVEAGTGPAFLPRSGQHRVGVLRHRRMRRRHPQDARSAGRVRQRRSRGLRF
jgi:glyoxylase I family protein